MAWRIFMGIGVTVVFIGLLALSVAQQSTPATDGRLISVYDRGEIQTFITDKATLREALAAQHIELDPRDTVEPSLDDKLVAPEYQVNIYRARPVVVVDGDVRVKLLTARQTASQIADDAGIQLYDEDRTTIDQLSPDTDGAGLTLTIDRAVSVKLDLYGKRVTLRTQEDTIGGLLREHHISLGAKDRLSRPEDTTVTAGLAFRIWREGIQTISEDQSIAPTSKIVYDTDLPLGTRKVQTKGQPGILSISYQIEIKNGKEVSRTELARVTAKKPKQETIVIGLRNDGGGLTLSKGAQYFTDSKGVSHRETYYDLNMSVVMQACGQGGYYTVRPDGAKVDRDGYVIIAANYSNYPRCSTVETSLGPGKVYDTGGFAARHPYGFDLATDWSRADGI